MKSKILIVGDAMLCAALMEQFAHQPEFEAAQAQSCSDALRAVSEGVDALLVDESILPATSDFIGANRLAGFCGAIILLATSLREAPSVDACISRPFRFHELLTQLRMAIASRAETETRTVVGAYYFSAASQALFDDCGARIALTEKEAAILARLSQSKTAVQRNILLAEVWGYSPEISTRTLETHIHRLRRKIEPDPARPRHLVTEPGGYRLKVADSEVDEGGE